MIEVTLCAFVKPFEVFVVELVNFTTKDSMVFTKAHEDFF